MFETVTNFLLNEWLWSITFGVYQIPVTILLLFLFLKLWDHLSITRALMVSIGLGLSAFIFFIGSFTLLSLIGFKMPYVQSENPYIDSYTVFFTTMSLALIYIIIQLLILFILSHWLRLNYYRAIVTVIVSNMASALFIAKIVHSL